MTAKPSRPLKTTKSPDRLFRFSALATIVGVAIALGAWLFPRPWSLFETSSKAPADSDSGLQSSTVIDDLSEPDPNLGTDLPSGSTTPRETPQPPPTTPIVEPPKPDRRPEPVSVRNPESRPRPQFPVTFTLAEGHQKVVANGELSVSGEFNQIGEMIVPTLHVQARGREPEDHALLSAGGRFEVAVGERTYVVAVIAADTSARRFEIEVDLLR